MTKSVSQPGRIVPAAFGSGYTYACRTCFASVRSVFDQMPKVPWCQTEQEATTAFHEHLLEAHPDQTPTADGCGLCGGPKDGHAHTAAAIGSMA